MDEVRWDAHCLEAEHLRLGRTDVGVRDPGEAQRHLRIGGLGRDLTGVVGQLQGQERLQGVPTVP